MAITNLPQKILQILIYIILRFLVWIYNPITITANCNLTTLKIDGLFVNLTSLVSLFLDIYKIYYNLSKFS